MFCPFCGAQMPENGSFCAKCGKKLGDAAGQSAPATQNTAPAQPVYVQAPAPAPVTVKVRGSRFGWIKWVVILAIIAGAAFAAYKIFFKSDEQLIRDRIDTLEEAYNDMDMEEMFGCFDKQTRKAYDTVIGMAEGLIGGVTGFDLPLGDMMELGGMEMGGEVEMEIEILSIEINDDEATVEITMNYGEKQESDTLKMCKEDSDWYIDYSGTTGQSIMSGFYQ